VSGHARWGLALLALPLAGAFIWRNPLVCALVGAAALMALLTWPAAARRAVVDGWLWIWTGCLAYAFLVASPDRLADLPATVLVLGMAILGARSAASHGSDTALAVCLAGIALVCAGSLAGGVFAPDTALVAAGYEQGSLLGPFVHRNQMGTIAGLGVVLAAGWLLDRRKFNWLTVLALLASGSALAWSNSRTAWVGTALGVCFMLLHASRASRVLRFSALVSLLLVSQVLLVTTEWLSGGAALLGRDGTLTGRTAIWQAVLDQVARFQPFGGGLTSTWASGSALDSAVWTEVGFEAFHSHQAWLDVLVTCGVVVLVPLVVLFLRASWRATEPLGPATGFATLPAFGALSYFVAVSADNSIFHLAYVAFVLGVVAAHPRSVTTSRGDLSRARDEMRPGDSRLLRASPLRVWAR